VDRGDTGALGSKKLKYVSNITMGQSPKSEECSYDEIGVPFLQGNAEFTNVHPIPKLYCNTANKFSKVNDILLSVRAPVGAMNISDRVYGIGRGLCAITAKKIQVKYLWYSLTVSLEELFIKSKGSTFEAVTVTDVQNLLIILPPKNEQDAIVNFLDQKTAEIDSLVTETKNQIQKLKEYRQSLISEAVTGKIDVREFQNKNEVIFRNE
jgi:type I restriction enzyme S subunit